MNGFQFKQNLAQKLHTNSIVLKVPGSKTRSQKRCPAETWHTHQRFGVDFSLISYKILLNKLHDTRTADANAGEKHS